MSVNDILDALNLFMVPQHVEMQSALPESEDERTLIALLSHEPLHVDELIRQSELPTMTVSATLLEMELKGMIKRVGSMQMCFSTSKTCYPEFRYYVFISGSIH